MHIYMADEGEIPLTDEEAGILGLADASLGNHGLNHEDVVRAMSRWILRQAAKRIEPKTPPPYHWLGAEAEDDGFITVRGLKNFQDFK